ncbi:hypothetical protein CU044_5627 [Streptomyces sp. L-9-10]|nr:hypothetical protein CU044_5627 [Streptomyces sp. L-9-10]
MGPGGLLGHRHSLLEAEGFCEGLGCAGATKNPSCREAGEGSASVGCAERFVLCFSRRAFQVREFGCAWH